MLNGIEYQYFHHPANNTRENERAVEIPIILKHLESRGTTLEVGNVLGQYVERRWTTVDLVEKEEGVTNCDILTWNGGPYDLVVSISTFEHIGRDFGNEPAYNAVNAVLHCCGLLTPKGRLVFTVPLGYHPVLDQWLLEDWNGMKSFLKRVSADNCWRQVEIDDVRAAKYGEPFRFANAIVVGEFVKDLQ